MRVLVECRGRRAYKHIKWPEARCGLPHCSLELMRREGILPDGGIFEDETAEQ